MSEITLLQVGKVFPLFIGMPEGCRASLTETGVELSIGFDCPTMDEIIEIRKGIAEFKLLEKNGVPIFLCKFGRLNWMDCPFVFEDKTVDDIPDGIGYALNVIFYDTATGAVCGLRTIGLGTQFSKEIQSMCHNTSNIPQREIIQNYRRLQDLYSTEQMAQMSTIGYVAGTKEI